MGEMSSFPSNGASSPGYLARPPAEPGRERGVVVIQEWWGLNQHVKNVVDRFAAAGFFALAPDLYRGTVTTSPDEAGKLLMALDIAQAEQDLRGSIRHLKAITGKPVGSVGFCMGGALSLYAACTSGADVGACVVYYGGHPKIAFPWDGLRAPVLGHWAEDDGFANATAAKVEAELRKREHPFEFHQYSGTRHAFFNDDRPAVYDRPAAEQSWERTLAFLRAHL